MVRHRGLMPGRLRIDVIADGPLRLTAGHRAFARGYVARSTFARAVGMLGTPDPRRNEALLLVPCAAVHGIGLRCTLAVAFIDATGVVMRVVDPLPWWGVRVRGAHAVIEACTGALAGLRPGDTVRAADDSVFPLVGNSARREGGASARLARCPVTDGRRPSGT